MTKSRLATLGALLADDTRAEILCLLMDGRAHTGGELARQVGLSPSTVSAHLSKLQDGQMVVVEPQGRHRYFRLASAEVAELLETLGAACRPVEVAASRAPAELRLSRAPAELRFARTCYDHLAGELAVRIHDRLLADGHLVLDDQQLRLTADGETLLAGIGVDIAAARAARRPTVRSCLDWTERRHHIAGSVGAALLDALVDKRWLSRGRKPRTVRLTDNGRQALQQHFDLSL